MKKLLLILFAFALTGSMAWGQTTIAYQGFEGTGSDTWSITSGSGNISSTTGSSDYPSNSRIRTGSYSWQVTNSTVTLELGSVDISSYNSVKITVHLSSTAGTSGNGADGADYIKVYANVDGSGYPATADIELDGNNNARWDYNASLTKSTNAGTPVTVAAPQGGSNSNNYATLEINISDGSSSVVFKLEAKNNSSSEHWNIDDIELSGTAASSNDQTTEVYYDISSQPVAGTISSIDDTQGEAVNVFKMTIEDQGSGDGLATHVTNIRIQPYSTNTADWTNTIQGVTLNDGSAVTIGTPTITDTYIDIPITSGNLDVVDGGSKDVTVGVYLNTSGITDGDVLSFKVTAASHGFTADASGSDFISTFTLGDFNSNDFTIQVTATELQFSGVPSSVTTGTDFSSTVSATDANGNVDTDDATSVTLSLKTGTGTLSSTTGLTQSLSSGTYTWSDLQYNTAESFTIAANGGSFAEVVTGSITASDPVKLFISEVADPGDHYQGRFVELYNAGTSSIDLGAGSWYLSKQTNGGSWYDVTLSGTINPGETFVIATNTTDFNTYYDFDPDQANTNISGNGDDGYYLYKNGDHSTGTLVDAYGVINEDGTGKAWEYEDSKAVRNSSVTNANDTWTSSEWTITSANVADMTPGTHGDCITFDGSSSATWSTAGNWVGGAVPTPSKNVKIPDGLSNTPSIDGTPSSPAECNNLTIASTDATLTIPTGKALTVHGDFTNNDYITINSASGATDGSLIVSGTVSGSGDFNIQRYLGYTSWDATHGWHFLSSPVAAQAISAFHTAGSGDDFYKWDESNDVWENRTTSGGGLNASFETNFAVGTGYLVAYGTATTKTFIGTINVSDVSVSSLSKDNDGWHLLGNPFPSALYWDKTTADWSLSNIVTTAKIWKESTAAYVDIAAGTGIIPSMQGFMVQASAASASLTIPASDRVHDATAWYKNSTNEENTLKLTVSEEQNNTAQESIIRINEDATTGFDPQFDSHFLAGFAPQFYSVLEDGSAVSTNTLPDISTSTTIPFAFIKNSAIDYTLIVEGINSLTTGEKVYLTDLKTNYIQNLSENPVYHFSAQDGDAVNRFKLYFGPLGVNENSINNLYSVYASHNLIKIQAEKAVNADVYVYNVAGQLIAKTTLNQQSYTSIDMKDFKGMAVVSIVSAGTARNHKVIVY